MSPKAELKIENDHFDLDHFDHFETASARQLMQAPLPSLNRSLDHFDHFETASARQLMQAPLPSLNRSLDHRNNLGFVLWSAR